MKDELFRREVIDGKRNSWLGGLSLAQPHQVWVLTGFVVLVAMGFTGFGILGEYTRRSRVTGQLIPDLGLATVVAPSSGVANRIFLAEGDVVEGGDALVRIDASRATVDGQDELAVVRSGLDSRAHSLATIGRSEISKINAQLSGGVGQLAMARQELRQLEEAAATRREQVRLGQANVARYRRIAGELYVSQFQVDQQEQAMLAQVNEQQALERQATAIRRDILRMEQSLLELEAVRAVQLAITERDAALLLQERVQHEAGGELLIKAPVAGLLASRLIEPGQAVQAGQPLLSILPKGSTLEAQLLVPSRAIGFVAPGDTVLLRYQAYPYQKFGHQVGRIARISRSAMVPGEAGAPSAGAPVREPCYRVLVKLDMQTVTAHGKQEPLRPGMLVEADILSERRRLYEWLFEPLYSLHGAVSGGK